MPSSGSIRAALVAQFRRRDPVVLWPTVPLGLGNLLYLWLQAHALRARGQKAMVLQTPKTLDWQPWFPAPVKQLTLPRREVSFFNPRLLGLMYQRFGDDYTREELEAFIDEMLLAVDSPFTDLLAKSEPSVDIAINIRRGDYYSVPKYRGWYSFDVVEYVKEAVSRANEQAPVRKALVVSDDLGWCRLKLAPLAEQIELIYPEPNAHPANQLALLVTSPRLILTNSTFSYWAGYLSNRWHARLGIGAQYADVWAPWFHSRAWNGSAADQLDPRWSVIRTIRGGWDG